MASKALHCTWWCKAWMQLLGNGNPFPEVLYTVSLSYSQIHMKFECGLVSFVPSGLNFLKIPPAVDCGIYSEEFPPLHRGHPVTVPHWNSWDHEESWDLSPMREFNDLDEWLNLFFDYLFNSWKKIQLTRWTLLISTSPDFILFISYEGAKTVWKPSSRRF